jgi:hypothetical protein
MFLIETYDKIRVHPLLWLSELVVFMNLHWKENPDTPTIVIINKTYLCVSVIYKAFQEFYAGEYQSPARYHVQIRPSDIREEFIVKFSCIGIVVRGIFRELFPLDLLEKLSPVWEYCLGPYACLCVSEGWRLNENLLGKCLDDGHRLWSKFQLFCNC